MIIRGPVVEGSYKSLKKAIQRQVNNVHVKHPMEKNIVALGMMTLSSPSRM